MQITHEEARQLIQTRSDMELEPAQGKLLASHLESCSECGKYAESLHTMESILRPLLQRQWNRRPQPLSLNSLASRSIANSTEGVLLATRIAALSAMFVAFLFSAWQFTQARIDSSRPPVASAAPAPIPLAFTLGTSTTVQRQTCGETVYRVQENDTLELIATRFALDKETLLTANQLTVTEVRAGMKLLVPVCGTTPTGTAGTSTTTFTPLLQTIVSTPGG